MADLGLSLIPLASFWVAFKSLLDAARFVNDIRDMVIFGSKEGVALSRAHRRLMFADWLICMIGIISAAFAFAGIIAFMAIYIAICICVPNIAVGCAVGCVSVLTLAAGVLFAKCGFADHTAMKAALQVED